MKVGDSFLIRSAVPGLPDQEIVFIGMQETGIPDEPGYALFNLTKDIEGHPAGSTVAVETLEEAGYIFPKDIYNGR